MTIIYSDDSGPVTWPTSDSHDPNSKKYYYISYRPTTRQNSKEYIKGVDVIIPTVSNGCMYECTSSGISASAEPTFGTVEGKVTEDGGVQWKCKPLICRLSQGDVITTSTWTGEVGVTTDNPLILNNISTTTRVTAVPSGVKKFTLTNHITITRASGRVEEYEKSLIIPIKEL